MEVIFLTMVPYNKCPDTQQVALSFLETYAYHSPRYPKALFFLVVFHSLTTLYSAGKIIKKLN